MEIKSDSTNCPTVKMDRNRTSSLESGMPFELVLFDSQIAHSSHTFLFEPKTGYCLFCGVVSTLGGLVSSMTP
ncbi:MAG TPA: hypothetical protein VK503_10925 [Candidatus Bathyarchaeia archaeon]|nr:hypothetical protein [Candidatus Bathyarchaeia archaeon]